MLAAPSGGARGPKSSTSARINQLGPRSAKAAQVQASLTVTESCGFVLSTPKCFCPTVSSNPHHATGAAMSKVLRIPLAAQGMKFQGNYLQVLQKLLTHVLHTHHRELRLLTSPALSQEMAVCSQWTQGCSKTCNWSGCWGTLQGLCSVQPEPSSEQQPHKHSSRRQLGQRHQRKRMETASVQRAREED